MAKDNRTINSAVRHGGKLYTAGMEDELQSDLSTNQLKRLFDRGAISGSFGKTAKAETEEPAEDEKPKGKK